jgi:hypothetical protein
MNLGENRMPIDTASVLYIKFYFIKYFNFDLKSEHVSPRHYMNKCARVTIQHRALIHVFIVDPLQSNARYLLNIAGHDLHVFFGEYSLVQMDRGMFIFIRCLNKNFLIKFNSFKNIIDRIVLNENVPLEAYGVLSRDSPSPHSSPNHFDIRQTNYNVFSASDIRRYTLYNNYKISIRIMKLIINIM